MKRSFFLIILSAVFVLMQACQNKPFNPTEMGNLCISGVNVFFEDENKRIISLDLEKDAFRTLKEKGSICASKGRVYLISEGNLYSLSDGGLNIIGTAPDSELARVFGVIGDWCYYVEWEKVCRWNYKTSETSILYSFEDVITCPLAVTSEGVFCGGKEGVYYIDSAKNDIQKVIEGYATGVLEADDTLYFSIATPENDSLQNGEDYTEVFGGAKYYRYRQGELSLVAVTEHAASSRTGFMVKEGHFFAIDENSERTKSYLVCIEEKGSELRVELSEHVDNEGGIVFDDNWIVFGSKTGMELWKYNIAEKKLEKIKR